MTTLVPTKKRRGWLIERGDVLEGRHGKVSHRLGHLYFFDSYEEALEFKCSSVVSTIVYVVGEQVLRVGDRVAVVQRMPAELSPICDIGHVLRVGQVDDRQIWLEHPDVERPLGVALSYFGEHLVKTTQKEDGTWDVSAAYAKDGNSGDVYLKPKGKDDGWVPLEQLGVPLDVVEKLRADRDRLAAQCSVLEAKLGLERDRCAAARERAQEADAEVGRLSREARHNRGR